jgi:hypothetical protein
MKRPQPSTEHSPLAPATEVVQRQLDDGQPGICLTLAGIDDLCESAINGAPEEQQLLIRALWTEFRTSHARAPQPIVFSRKLGELLVSYANAADEQAPDLATVTALPVAYQYGTDPHPELTLFPPGVVPGAVVSAF